MMELYAEASELERRVLKYYFNDVLKKCYIQRDDVIYMLDNIVLTLDESLELSCIAKVDLTE